MNEQTTTAAGAVAAGAGAAALSYLGLEPAPLFWAVVGATLGMVFAAASSRPRFWAVFVAVVLSCSLFGSWLAQLYMAGGPTSRNALACLLAIFFHPMLNAGVNVLPEAVAGILRRLGIGANP